MNQVSQNVNQNRQEVLHNYCLLPFVQTLFDSKCSSVIPRCVGTDNLDNQYERFFPLPNSLLKLMHFEDLFTLREKGKKTRRNNLF